MKTAITAICAILLTFVLISPAVMADTWPPSSYKAGDEKAKLGHTFKEEYWTSEFSNVSNDGTTHTFVASYANYQNVQAFLVAYKTAEKNGTVSTLPYQFFGMHYYTEGGREVLLGAVLAFLMAYNDTYDGTGPGQNGVPDPGNENVYYIIPFGVGDLPLFKNDTSYKPQVEAIQAKKIADGEYEFGMTYKNMYAKIIDGNSAGGFWLSVALPLYIAKFSELTVKYHIKMDKANNKITAETFYTIGQIDKLWLWGQSIDPQLIPSNWGIAAVHFVSTFVSTFTTTDNANQSVGQLQAGMSRKVTDIKMKVGTDDRAFDIGFRGTFDLIDEKNSNAVIKSNQNALNLLVGARLNDLILVAWQGGLSVGLMGYFSYAMSPQLQKDYTSPYDLVTKGGAKFWGGAFWYAVCFPGWDGYRVVHDPVYTAYSSFKAGKTTPTNGRCGSIIMFVIGSSVLVSYSGVRVLRKKDE